MEKLSMLWLSHHERCEPATVIARRTSVQAIFAEDGDAYCRAARTRMYVCRGGGIRRHYQQV